MVMTEYPDPNYRSYIAMQDHDTLVGLHASFTIAQNRFL